MRAQGRSYIANILALSRQKSASILKMKIQIVYYSIDTNTSTEV